MQILNAMAGFMLIVIGISVFFAGKKQANSNNLGNLAVFILIFYAVYAASCFET